MQALVLTGEEQYMSLTRQQDQPKILKKKFQPREMSIDANTVRGALSLMCAGGVPCLMHVQCMRKLVMRSRSTASISKGVIS